MQATFAAIPRTHAIGTGRIVRVVKLMSVPQKILPLTSLRFIAALYVVLFHTLSQLYPGSVGGLYSRFLSLGYISVSFFFVLSGYILAVVYLKQERAPRSIPFWAARFARIYPLFVLSLLLDTPLFFWWKFRSIGLHAAAILTTKVIFANCLQLQSWFVNLRGIDNPNWSLSVETFFYVLFPLIAVLCLRRTSRTLVGILIISYVAGLAMVSAMSRLPLPEEFLKYCPALHLHEFIGGICLALLSMRLTESQELLLKKLSPYLFTVAVVALAGVALIANQIPFLLIHDGLLSPLYLIVILSLSREGGNICRMLSHQSLVVLGEASYALYLLHVPFWHIAQHLPYGHRLMTYPIYLVGTIALSVLSLYSFEIPSRKFLLARMHISSRETVLSSSVAQ